MPPTKIAPACNYPGCGGRGYAGKSYCREHQKFINDRGFNDKQAADQKFYRSTLWRKTRNSFITRNPICAECGALAQVVDHITPISQGGDRFSATNLQSLCASCHDEKRRLEAKTNVY